LLSLHGRECIEELVEAVAAGEELEEDSRRHASSEENGGTAEDLGVAVDDCRERFHVSTPCRHGTAMMPDALGVGSCSSKPYALAPASMRSGLKTLCS
jgi:hypothetical protein